jgi:hypothetical protein
MSVRKNGSLLLALLLLQLSAGWAQEPSAGNRITGGQTIPQSNFPPPVGSPPVLNATVGQMGLNSTGTFNLGIGTLIGPQQVLFSAQTITDPNTGQLINPNVGTDLRFLLSGTTYAGRAVAIHPTWFGVLNPIIPAEGHFDLAVLILSQQVVNVTPTPLLRQVPPVTLLIGGFGDLSAAGMCGPAITGFKPPPGLIQAATTNQIIPPSPTPTFLICNGGAVSPYPMGNIVTPGVPGVDYPVPVLPTQQFNDIGAPALVLDPPTPGPTQAWKLAGMATYNTRSWSCGQRGFYVRLDVPQATQFIDQFISPNIGLPPPPPDADLAITSATLPANPIVGVPYTFTATILNVGKLNAGPFLVAAFIDNATPVLGSFGADAVVQVLGIADPTPSPNIYSPAASVNGLAVGQSVTVTLTVTFKTSGSHTLKIQADPDHNVNESNIFNNTFLFKEKVLSTNIDLTIPIVIKQTIGGIDTGFTVVIENDGLATAGPFTLAAFSNLLDSPDLALKQDSTIPPPTADLGQIAVPGVPANSSVVVGVNLPNGATRNGRAWFWANPPTAIGNPLTPLAEDNTTNNIATATWGVAGGSVNINSPLSSTSNLGNVAQVGTAVTFSVGGSATDVNGASTPLTFKWDFGDGTQAITNSPTVTHVYQSAGTYAVSVMISSGPNSTATSVVNFSATINPTVTLGPVSVSARRGSFSLKLPVPAVFSRRDRMLSKLISADAGLNIKYANNRVTGKLNSTNVGNRNFVVNYNAPKTGKQTQVTYTLIVTP